MNIPQCIKTVIIGLLVIHCISGTTYQQAQRDLSMLGEVYLKIPFGSDHEIANIPNVLSFDKVENELDAELEEFNKAGIPRENYQLR